MNGAMTAGLPFGWAAGLAFGLPAAVIALGLLTTRLRRANSPLEGTARWSRNLLAPLVAIYLALAHVADLPGDHVAARTALTAALLTGLGVLLAFVVAVLFGAAPEGSNRAKTPKLLRDLITVVLVGLGAVVVLSAVWGQDVAAPFAALGIGSVVIGLALQETLGNVMSGIALLLERPFSEGDWIEIDGHEGRVAEINWRAVRIVNRDGDTVVVPHTRAAGGIVLNNTAPTTVDRTSVDIGFSYDDAPNRVREVLLEAAAATEGIRAEPAPRVLNTGYGDSSIDYVVHYFIDHPQLKPAVRSRFLTLVWYAAQRSGLTIPFPIRTVFHHDADEAGSDATEAALREAGDTPLLRGALAAGEIDAWAGGRAGARLAHFAGGETVLAAGEKARTLYLVVAGEARLVSARGGELYRIGAGEFFGELTVFSGAASPYGVTAEGDMEALALPREAVDRLIAAKPSLAVEIGQVMDARRRAVAAR